MARGRARRCLESRAAVPGSSGRAARSSRAGTAARARARTLRSRRRPGAALAPTSRAAANTASVGIDRMPKRCAEIRELVGVHLDDDRPSGLARRDLLQLRRDHAARSAPRRPVVDDDRQRRAARSSRSKSADAAHLDRCRSAARSAACTCRTAPARRDGRRRGGFSARTIRHATTTPRSSKLRVAAMVSRFYAVALAARGLRWPLSTPAAPCRAIASPSSATLSAYECAQL